MARYLGDILCERIVAAFCEPLVAGPARKLVQADVDTLIDRAISAYFQRNPHPISAVEAVQWRQYAVEIVAEASEGECIENGTGATGFIVFAFAYGACLMRSREFNSTAMRGAMAAVDNHLCNVWRQAGVEMAPSTRPRSAPSDYLKLR